MVLANIVKPKKMSRNNWMLARINPDPQTLDLFSDMKLPIDVMPFVLCLGLKSRFLVFIFTRINFYKFLDFGYFKGTKKYSKISKISPRKNLSPRKMNACIYIIFWGVTNIFSPKISAKEA